MKADPDVKMISAEAPILFAKGCDIFITELTMRAWIHAEENKRRTLQRSDIASALAKSDMFDFLIDIVPREEPASHGNKRSQGGQAGVNTGPASSAPAAGMPAQNNVTQSAQAPQQAPDPQQHLGHPDYQLASSQIPEQTYRPQPGMYPPQMPQDPSAYPTQQPIFDHSVYSYNPMAQQQQQVRSAYTNPKRQCGLISIPDVSSSRSRLGC